MRRVLPRFFQRRLLRAAARRMLAAGRAKAALEVLRDELLLEDSRAIVLRREAELRIAELQPAPSAPPAPLAPPARSAAAAPPAREDLRQFLARMRAAAPASSAFVAASAAGIARIDTARAGSSPAGPTNVPLAMRFRMNLDDGGSLFVAAGTRAVIGHSRGGRADLPFLADVAPAHAAIEYAGESFHGGARWSVAPLGAAPVRVNGAAIEGARSLQHGDRMAFGANLVLRFLLPDASSSSALLEVGGGLDCDGAHRVLLAVPGVDGRVRIGARETNHLRAALSGSELELLFLDHTLRLACAAGLVLDGVAPAPPAVQLDLPCPPPHALQVRIGATRDGARPAWITVEPLDAA